jgi:streptogramin lyase
MTTGGVVAEFPTSLAASNPYGITTGPDRKICFTEYEGNQIGRTTTGADCQPDYATIDVEGRR